MTALEVPSARSVRSELGRLRRGHSDLTIWQLLEIGYVYVFTVLMIGSMGGVAVAQAWRELSDCAEASCAANRSGLSLLVGVTALVLALRGLLAVGPVVAGRAAATWLLATPVERRGLLQSKVVGLLAAGAVVGAMLFGWLASMPNQGAVNTLVLGALAGAAIGLLVVAAATVAQQRPRSGRLLVMACDGWTLAALLATPFLLMGPFSTSIGQGWASPGPLLVATGIAGALAVGAAVRGIRDLARLSRRDLLAGGDLLSGLSGAAASMDTSMIADLLVQRRFRRLGASRSRPGRGRGLSTLPIREIQRALRSPVRLGLAVGLLVVPYVAWQIGFASVVPAVAAIVGYLALRPLGGGLHVLSRSPGLRRAFPYRDRLIRLALATPALVAAAIWSLGVLPVLPGPVAWVGVATTIGAAIVRSVTRPPVSFDGALISTPAGALPAGFVAQIFRGPDVLVIGAILLTLAGSVPVLFAVPALILIYVLLRS